MQESGTDERPERIHRRRWRLWILWGGGAVLLAAIAAGVGVKWLIRNAAPILRRRVVETLSARFNSPVELDSLQLAYNKKFLVKGSGLRILYLAGPTKPDAKIAARPMLTVGSFEFTAGLRELLQPTTRVLTVRVQGMQIDVPPHPNTGTMPDNPKRRGQPRWGIAVDKIICTDTKLVLETNAPEKKPLVFTIGSLTLTDVGAKKPFRYEAVLVNPKPVGEIRSTGEFGPWQDDNPRDTPVNGSYAFSHVDLSSIRGIGGILSSTGRFGGTLGNIDVDGVTDTPDFRLDVSGHPVGLHTEFHATVNGTTGDTWLNPVKARVLRSTLTATGSVTRTKGVPGHDTELNVVMSQGRIEDMLVLGVKTVPALMTGDLTMKARISLPPGAASVSKRLRMQGKFEVRGGRFSNAAMQAKINELSMRAQGKTELAKVTGAPAVTSEVSGSFFLADAELQVNDLHYEMPGAALKMDGSYGLDTSAFAFHGTVRTEATASQMTTGWKSMLLSPFDSLFKKNGAGMEVPVKVTGAHATYDIRLDYGHGKSTAAARHR